MKMLPLSAQQYQLFPNTPLKLTSLVIGSQHSEHQPVFIICDCAMSENCENPREKYTEILHSNGIHDKVSQVIVEDSGAKGDGVASLTQCVTVKFENEEKAPLNLFVKMHTGNPTHEALLDALKAFEKESRFLMEYLPEARKLCKSKGLGDLLDFFPKCYYGDEKLIVLENLVLDKGYKILPHEERHDINAADLSLKMLAKYHAVSFAMIREFGGKDKFFQRFPDLDHDAMNTPMLTSMMVGFFENALQTSTTILEKNKLDDQDILLAKLKGLSSGIKDVVAGARTMESEKLMVLIHGDCKNNNLMFLKNKETSALEHLMAIDFQCASYDTPVLDLAVYLFSSVDSNLRQTRIEELLNIYRHTLNQVSRDLGHPIDLSYEDLLLLYRRKFKFGFFFGLSMVGPGMGIFKLAGVDVGTVDMGELANVFTQLLHKWIDENPEIGRKLAEEVRNLLEEYDKWEL